MDVYFVPIGRDRFECYYEAPDDDEARSETGKGFFERMKARFHGQLRDVEHLPHQPAGGGSPSLFERFKRRTMRWIAERVAEQRLLWRLRTAVAATLHVPADLDAGEAERMMRESMKRDADRHRVLLAVHAVLLILSVPVAIVPGPNFFGYIFTFTVTGHFLAWRGARRGLVGVRWDVRPSDELAALRQAFALDAGARHDRIRDVADRLNLPRLAVWVKRMAAPTA